MELIKNQIQFCDRILDRTTVYEESTDAIVPDSFPDIAHIVYAAGNTLIKDESPQTDRILVSGTVRTTILYQPEGEEGLRELSIPLSFAHIEEGKGITADSPCFVSCRVVGVDARAVNSRKVSVTARMCCEANAYTPRELEITQDVDSGELPIELRYEEVSVPLLRMAAVRDFTVLDDLETSATGDTRLIHTRCTLSANEVRTMRGKAVVKGDARVHTLLLEGDGLRTAEHTVPFTQILDCESLTEEQPVAVRFAVRNIDSELHEGGILSIGIGACALLTVTQEQTVRTIADLYQTTHPLEVQSRVAHLIGMEPLGELHADTGDTVQIGIRPVRVIDAHATCYAITQEDPRTLRMTTAVNLLVQQEDGRIYGISRTASLPVSLPQPMEGGTAQSLALSVSATPSGEDSLNLRVHVDGKLYHRTDYALNDITQIEVGSPEQDTRDAVTLVLRYIDETEALWDIAKHYHTTARAIRGANDLASDAAEVSKRMLLIPICEK